MGERRRAHWGRLGEYGMGKQVARKTYETQGGGGKKNGDTGKKRIGSSWETKERVELRPWRIMQKLQDYLTATEWARGERAL